MRVLPSNEHQQRKEKILQAVVHIFIRTGKPVGSSTIVENYDLSLSPASIRNVLAELEREEFLSHPHTSAGRVPTDKGYRFYVNAIVNIQRLAVEEETRIREEYSSRMREIENLMLSTTRVLSALSHCTGFVMTPLLEAERLRRVELIPVNSTQVLGVLVSESGMIRNQTIMVDQTPDEESLHAASRFLNERLSGLSFPEAQARFISELEQFHAQHVIRREFLDTLSHRLFHMPVKSDLYVEGASNIFQFPEFQDYESMRNFSHLVDEKKALGELFNKELNKRGLQVKIGSETSPELKNFSVVSSGYEVNGRPVGVLGILGPKRMEYSRMMSIVNTVAGLVNRILEGHEVDLMEEQAPYDTHR